MEKKKKDKSYHTKKASLKSIESKKRILNKKEKKQL